MLESCNFIFDGVNSKDMGVRVASTSGGLFQESFLPNRTIVEREVTHREKPYLQRVENKPLSFSMGFLIEDWDKPDSLRKIAKWLFQPYYKPLILDANPNRIFYVIVEGDSSLFHNGAKEGYVELSFRGDSPYSYTAEHNTENIQFRTTDTYSIVEDSRSTFTGSHNNTVLLSNGITIDKVVDTWGDLYINKKKWGEII